MIELGIEMVEMVLEECGRMVAMLEAGMGMVGSMVLIVLNK